MFYVGKKHGLLFLGSTQIENMALKTIFDLAKDNLIVTYKQLHETMFPTLYFSFNIIWSMSQIFAGKVS
jgi:hypothetical protein